jgi:hypothetical protein
MSQTGNELSKEQRTRAALADLICEREQTVLEDPITRLGGYEYIFGENARGEAVCLVWPGDGVGLAREADLAALTSEVERSGLRWPCHVYAVIFGFTSSECVRIRRLSEEVVAQFDRERLLVEYVEALDRADFDGVSAILDRAMGDHVLDEMIHAANTEMARAEGIELTAQEADEARAIVRKVFDSFTAGRIA